MLTTTLMQSLKITSEAIGRKLRHVVYDGVYADTLERVRGGGSLSLVGHLEEHLGLEPGTITGHWDSGHKMELVYSAIFKGKNAVPAMAALIDDVI